MATGTGRTTGKRNQPRAELRPVGVVSPQPHQEEELLLHEPVQVIEETSVVIQQGPRQRLQMQVGLESPLDLQVQQETMSVPRQRLQMHVGLESPLDLQAQRETMSDPQKKLQMQVGTEPPPDLHEQGEAMLSVKPRQNLFAQAEEVRPQHDLQMQLGDAPGIEASHSPRLGLQGQDREPLVTCLPQIEALAITHQSGHGGVKNVPITGEEYPKSWVPLTASPHKPWAPAQSNLSRERQKQDGNTSWVPKLSSEENPSQNWSQTATLIPVIVPNDGTLVF